MIIEKDGKNYSVNPIVWNDEVRIFSDAKEVFMPEKVFLCKGIISNESHCEKLMEAVSLCKSGGIAVGLVLTDKNSNPEIIEKCADNSDIKDCIFLNEPGDTDYAVADEIHLPSMTMYGYYFVGADRICGDNANDLFETITAMIEDAR